MVVAALLQLLNPSSILFTTLLISIVVDIFFYPEHVCKVVGLFGCAGGLNLIVNIVELFEELFYAETVVFSHHSLEAVDVFSFHINLVVFEQLD